ncbi:MAG: hypothetical protein ACPGMR_13640 [Pontibacterium sp.]
MYAKKSAGVKMCLLALGASGMLATGAQAADYDGFFDLNVGYSTLDADWNIASDITGTQTPNVISELTWDNLQLGYIAIDSEKPFLKGSPLVIRGRYQLGLAFSGDNQDSDYDGDNRTLEFSRSNNKSAGYTSDLTFGVGYRLESRNGNFAVTPNVGYSNNLQHFSITDGYQTINTRTGATGPFSGLDSVFESRWFGPYVGLKVDSQLNDLWLQLSLDYMFADYYAYGDWNLRSDLQHPKSFEHFSTGTAIKGGLKATYAPRNSDFEVSLEYALQHYVLDPGTIQFNGTSRTSVQRLNGGTTQSQYIGIAVNRFF